MARMRSIKPEFWADEDLAALSRDARLLYVGLWNLADEHGRLRGDPRYVKGQLFPYDDDITAAVADSLLQELAGAGKVVRYSVDSGRYLFLPNLAKHQRLDADKTPSRLPGPEDGQYDPEQPGNSPDSSGKNPDSVTKESKEEFPQVKAQSGNFPDESGLARARSFSKEHVVLEHVAGSKVESPAPVGAKSSRSQADADFERFWAAYPRREAKGAARKAWDKAILRADPDRILEAAQRYRDHSGRDPKFTAHAATWLNADRWTDEPARESPPRGLVEHNGLRLKPETIANLEGRARFEAMDQQIAIEGTAS